MDTFDVDALRRVLLRAYHTYSPGNKDAFADIARTDLMNQQVADGYEWLVRLAVTDKDQIVVEYIRMAQYENCKDEMDLYGYLEPHTIIIELQELLHSGDFCQLLINQVGR